MERPISDNPPSDQPKSSVKQIALKQYTNHNIRAGDWICVFCSNYNYSFRRECNRCHNQSVNYYYSQSYPKESTSSQTNSNNILPNNRKPLNDLTKQLVKQNQINTNQQQRGFESVILVQNPSKNIISFQEKYQQPKKIPNNLPSIQQIIKDIETIEQNNTRFKDFDFELIAEDEENDVYQDLDQNQNLEALQIYQMLTTDEEKTKVPEQFAQKISQLNQRMPQNTNYDFFQTQNNSSSSNNTNNDSKIINNFNEGASQQTESFQLKKEDWVCTQCKNLNYSFRVICNRCQMPKLGQ